VEEVFTKVPNYFSKNTKKESDLLLISMKDWNKGTSLYTGPGNSWKGVERSGGGIEAAFYGFVQR
jgi:hypothetical protein